MADRDGQREIKRVGAQSRLMSLVEATTNVAMGFLVAVVTQLLLFPLLGLIVTMHDNMIIGSVFTPVSLLRSFLLRRLFESFTARFGQNSLQ